MPAIRLVTCLRLLAVAALAVVLLLMPAQSGYGQGDPPRRGAVRGQGSWVSIPPASPTPTIFATTQVTGTQFVYLPLIAVSPSIRIQFGSGVDSQGNLIDPGTAFAYGITHLYYRYTAEGAAGRSYRTEWIVNGARQTLLDESGTIPSTPAMLTSFFCSPTLGPCGPPVPRGVYQVTFFIDDVAYQQATATVQ